MADPYARSFEVSLSTREVEARLRAACRDRAARLDRRGSWLLLYPKKLTVPFSTAIATTALAVRLQPRQRTTHRVGAITRVTTRGSRVRLGTATAAVLGELAWTVGGAALWLVPAIAESRRYHRATMLELAALVEAATAEARSCEPRRL